MGDLFFPRVNKMSGVESIPFARRLIRSLRDMGYDFAQPVAEIVDYGITAKASNVSVDQAFDGDDPAQVGEAIYPRKSI